MVTLSSTGIQKIDRIKRCFVNCVDASSNPDRLGSRLEGAGPLTPLPNRIIVMSYEIIVFGHICHALDGAYVLYNIDLHLARRPLAHTTVPPGTDIRPKGHP